jgi:tRNA-splicing ligase RtcB
MISDEIAIWGDHEAKTIKQIERCAQDDRVVRAALCADGHLGYAVPIGGIVAYRDAISPSGVGCDIACGNKAVRLDMPGHGILRHRAADESLLSWKGRRRAFPHDAQLFAIVLFHPGVYKGPGLIKSRGLFSFICSLTIE